MSLNDFKNEIKELGSVFQSSGKLDLQDVDDIITRLKRFWKDEEILIYCKPSFTNNLINIFTSPSKDADYGVFKSDDKAGTRFLCEMSFCRRGLTFHVIEKPNVNGSIWIAISEESTARNSLIII